jgi:fibronectin type 3 domain-containing protein
MLTCAKREGGVNDRTNPLDANGINDTLNIPPSVKVHVPANAGIATWKTFSFLDSTGSVELVFSGFDSNGVQDTLRYSLFFGLSPTVLSRIDSAGLDSFYSASNLKGSTRYYYRCVVRDRHLDSAVDTGSFLTTGGFPPAAPYGLAATDGLYAIQVAWNSVSGAQGYCVYRSDLQNGWYSKIATLTGITYYDSVQDYNQFFYRVASYNSSGENRSTEFATARRIFSYDQPFLVSASKNDTTIGLNRIKITLQNNSGYSNSKTYSCHLYRANSQYGKYLDIQEAQANSAVYAPAIFYDTVINSLPYFYKVAVFDDKGRGSMLSECDSGWTQRLGSTYVSPSNGTYGPYILLTWDVVSGAKGYYIYRSVSGHTTLDTTYRIIDSTSLTSYKDSVPSDKISYNYIIVAYNNSGTGMPSTMQYGKRLAPPTGFMVDRSNTSTEFIYLTWSSSYTSSYCLYRSRDKQTWVRLDTLTSAYYMDSIKDYSLYYYAVSTIYFTTLSESAKSPPDSGRLKPLVPDSLWAIQSGVDTITLRWTKAKGAVGYHVFRSPESNTSLMRAIDTTADTTCVDIVTNDSSSLYRVSAYNESGDGQYGPGIYQKRLSVPPSPTNFTVTSTAAGINLFWVPDHYTSYASPAKGYYIYRTTDSTKYPFSVIDTVTDTVFTDTEMDTKTYFYKVKGYNDAGEGKFAVPGYYGIISGQRKIPSEPDSLKASQGDITNAIRVWWQRSVGTDTFRVYRYTSCSYPDSFKLRTTTVDTSYTDAVTDDSLYSYRVVASNIIGSSSLLLGQNCVTGFRMPSTVPRAPVLTSISQGATFTVYWTAPDSGARVTGYHLYRALNDSINGYSCIDTLSSTSYSDANAPLTYPPNTYYYKVRAYNAVGESVDSNVKQARH